MRRLRNVLVALSLVALTGCPDPMDREAMPMVTVVATADPSFFRVGSRLMGPHEVQAELARIANGSRRQLTGSARMIVRLQAEPGADYSRLNDVVQWCQDLGIQQVQRAP